MLQIPTLVGTYIGHSKKQPWVRMFIEYPLVDIICVRISVHQPIWKGIPHPRHAPDPIRSAPDLFFPSGSVDSPPCTPWHSRHSQQKVQELSKAVTRRHQKNANCKAPCARSQRGAWNNSARTKAAASHVEPAPGWRKKKKKTDSAETAKQ